MFGVDCMVLIVWGVLSLFGVCILLLESWSRLLGFGSGVGTFGRLMPGNRIKAQLIEDK